VGQLRVELTHQSRRYLKRASVKDVSLLAIDLNTYHISAIQTLRHVWVQQFELVEGHVRFRSDDNIPPPSIIEYAKRT